MISSRICYSRIDTLLLLYFSLSCASFGIYCILISNCILYSDVDNLFIIEIRRTHHNIAHNSKQHDDYAEEHGGCAYIRRNLWQHLLSIFGGVCCSRIGVAGTGAGGAGAAAVVAGTVVGWNTISCVVRAMVATSSATG